MSTDLRNAARAGGTSWDHAVDLLVVGSGAGAMTTAICAHDRGGKALLIEKTPLYGGASAMSGGSLWIPNNHLMAAAGVDDTPAEALAYLEHITSGAVPREKLVRYVETAPKMLRYLSERGRLRMQSMLTYTDYDPEAPGENRADARSSPTTSTLASSETTLRACASRLCRSSSPGACR